MLGCADFSFRVTDGTISVMDMETHDAYFKKKMIMKRKLISLVFRL